MIWTSLFKTDKILDLETLWKKFLEVSDDHDIREISD